jgi:hypothetical protein
MTELEKAAGPYYRQFIPSAYGISKGKHNMLSILG